MELINSYMRKNKIEKNTQAKIRRYLEYEYLDREKMKHTKAVNNILHNLPKNLNH